MDFADKLDMMDDDCDIQGFPDENLLKETTMKQNWEKEIGEFIRDVTKVGSIPKSEVRGRLSEIMREAKQEERDRILKELPEDKYYPMYSMPEANKHNELLKQIKDIIK